MAQGLSKNTACSSKGSEFNSQQPHSGSQPSVMRSGALLRISLGQLSSSTQTMKPNMDKFNRTAKYGLPIHVSALPGHKFHFLFHFSRVIVLFNPSQNTATSRFRTPAVIQDCTGLSCPTGGKFLGKLGRDVSSFHDRFLHFDDFFPVVHSHKNDYSNFRFVPTSGPQL